ncbi:RNA polymerase sigma factor [Carboxylicivirga taeanensis]|uniref:RNA polymerase sigma factor n=1 Tax=Carboxylicivirga taeanensis TaxID=1416875 RepID=UPI003F6DA8B2
MQYNQQREVELSEQFLRSGDIASYSKLYKYYFRSLCFFAYGYLNDKKAAEDAVQDVFIKVWEQKSEINDAKKLGGYLYASVRNKCHNILRKEELEQRFLADISSNDSVAWEEEDLQAIKSEVYREVVASIDKLPARMKEVFQLSYISRMSEAEISDVLNISVNSIKTHKKRAKSILRKELKHLLGLLVIFHL